MGGGEATSKERDIRKGRQRRRLRRRRDSESKEKKRKQGKEKEAWTTRRGGKEGRREKAEATNEQDR